MMKTTRRRVLHAMSGVAAGAILADAQARQTSSRSVRRAKWDVVVVGAGVFGAWTAWHLNQAGRKVLLVDAWGPANAQSSSGGESRLIRTEYAGDELYTRMAWESLREWQWLARSSGLPIFNPVGALYFYRDHHKEVAESMALHARVGIPMVKLSHVELVQRYPQIAFGGIALGILQPTMGALMARRSIQALVTQFLSAGGEYRKVAVQAPRPGASLGEIESLELAEPGRTGSSGETLHADQYVFACGPWLPKLFPDVIGTRIVATRQDVFFFAPRPGDERFDAGHLPAWVDADDEDLHYGFPSLEQRGFKIALDARGPRFDPDVTERIVSAESLASVREYLAQRFPGLAQRPLVESRVCQYENSASGDLIIDRHPQRRNAWIVGGGSGHGFKHGPAVGRYTAQLITDRLASPQPRFALAQHGPQDASH